MLTDALKNTDKLLRKFVGTLVGLALLGLIAGCAVAPETQAKINQYNATIPSCSDPGDCERKWAEARRWTLQNSDFPLFTESETRIHASSTLSTSAGVGIIVHREVYGDGYEFLVEVECFTVYGCPDTWDRKLDFNQTLNGAGS